MRLPPELVRAAPLAAAHRLRFDLSPLQLGLCGSPWHVAAASMLMVRVRHDRGLIAHALTRWPTPTLMASADAELAEMLQPLGLHNQRARRLSRLGLLWGADGWNDLRDIPGVGAYVADAVQLFCFGNADMQSADGVLLGHAAVYRGVRMCEHAGGWAVFERGADGTTVGEFGADVVGAYEHWRRRRVV